MINFDDLTYAPVYLNDPLFADVPLNNQYLSQGLRISEAYLLPYDDLGFDPVGFEVPPA